MSARGPSKGAATSASPEPGEAGADASHPSHATRFSKGRSGNPSGRPRKTKPELSSSSFDIVLDRTLVLTQGGVARDMTVDEALQHKTYQSAIAGDRAAQREVFRMIAKRERALALQPRPVATRSALVHFEEDPDNADTALLILGLATHDAWWQQYGDEDADRRLLLEPWAVQAALDRRGRPALSPADVETVERSTRAAETLVWPRGRKR